MNTPFEEIIDVAIIGGGINGCGCAADAALRGLSVLLCEQDDLASKTSSNSSKLIHGGLRYLEHFDFPLVKKALDERQRLLALAPHLVHPLPFVLPYYPHGRSHWMLRIGLFIYDKLSRKNKLPKHRTLKRPNDTAYFSSLRNTLNRGFLFYDCKTDDSRLVLANALQARKHGARILTQTKLTHAVPLDKHWQLTLQPQHGEAFIVRARSVINATGPWVNPVSALLKTSRHHHLVTLVQGSHLVVPKLYEGEHAYLLQDDGSRIIFAIPYNNLTLIGTTETLFEGDPNHVEITPSEINYLCDVINRYFKRLITPQDIISTFSGVRTLVSSSQENPTAISRDYAFQFSVDPAPVITILSGKLTTYRELAERVIDAIKPLFPGLITPSPTRNMPLPGTPIHGLTWPAFELYFQETYAWLGATTIRRYLDTYGVDAERIVAGKITLSELGVCFGADLYQAEVDYLIQSEWAKTTDDILWRRTKLGLRMDKMDIIRLQQYLYHTD